MTYTLAFSARSSTTREIRVEVGNDSYRVPVAYQWRRYVLTFKPTQSATTVVKFGLGREDSVVWLDSAFLFNKDAEVFQREFENGMVLANATAGAKTISIGAGFRRINGTQDPINDGKAVSNITLPPFDGIILVRDDSVTGTPDSGTGEIGDYVWRDTDGDGRQDAAESGWAGVVVRLRKCNGVVLATTQTDSNGKYLFKGLDYGMYQVEFTRPSVAKYSPFQTGGGGRLADSDARPETGLTWCYDMTSGTPSRLGIDAGLVPSDGDAKSGSGGSIGDLVWNDLDRDGHQDGNEPGVGNVTVQLRDCSGLWLKGTTTAGNGSFLFDGLAGGDYMLRFVAPSGAKFTWRMAGADTTADSDADGNGWSLCVSVPAGSSRRGVDAGLLY